MLKKQQRYSFKEGMPKYKFITPFFVLRYQKNPLGLMKLGVVVSKKVDMKATKRNSIKRKLVHVIKEITKKNSIPFDLVFFVKKSLVEQKKPFLIEEVKKALSVIK